MNELDQVRVRQTVTATDITDGLQIEIRGGWEGVIVECAGTHAPMVEFMKYRGEPVIAHIEATNLEVGRAVSPPPGYFFLWKSLRTHFSTLNRMT
jgi:hypothetical protein